MPWRWRGSYTDREGRDVQSSRVRHVGERERDDAGTDALEARAAAAEAIELLCGEARLQVEPDRALERRRID